MGMDHIIENLKEWLRVYKDLSVDEKAIDCIENAIKELEKYYYEE